jgi:hypothetical protein
VLHSAELKSKQAQQERRRSSRRDPVVMRAHGVFAGVSLNGTFVSKDGNEEPHAVFAC